MLCGSVVLRRPLAWQRLRMRPLQRRLDNDSGSGHFAQRPIGEFEPDGSRP